MSPQKTHPGNVVPIFLKLFHKIDMEGMLLNALFIYFNFFFYRASIVLYATQVKTTKKKFQGQSPNEHRRKYSKYKTCTLEALLGYIGQCCSTKTKNLTITTCGYIYHAAFSALLCILSWDTNLFLIMKRSWLLCVLICLPTFFFICCFLLWVSV